MARCPICGEAIEWLAAYGDAPLYCVEIDNEGELIIEAVDNVDWNASWFFNEFYCPECGAELPIESEEGARDFLLEKGGDDDG